MNLLFLIFIYIYSTDLIVRVRLAGDRNSHVDSPSHSVEEGANCPLELFLGLQIERIWLTLKLDAWIYTRIQIVLIDFRVSFLRFLREILLNVAYFYWLFVVKEFPTTKIILNWVFFWYAIVFLCEIRENCLVSIIIRVKVIHATLIKNGLVQIIYYCFSCLHGIFR